MDQKVVLWDPWWSLVVPGWVVVNINKVSFDFERIYGISLVPLVPRDPRWEWSRWCSFALCFTRVLREANLRLKWNPSCTEVKSMLSCILIQVRSVWPKRVKSDYSEIEVRLKWNWSASQKWLKWNRSWTEVKSEVEQKWNRCSIEDQSEIEVRVKWKGVVPLVFVCLVFYEGFERGQFEIKVKSKLYRSEIDVELHFDPSEICLAKASQKWL